MIIDKYKTIFVHVPKTAGVSIVHSFLYDLRGVETKGTIALLPDNIKERYSLVGKQKHRTALEYDKEVQDKFKNYYKFAFVRNPWDKLVSEFHWRMTRQKDKKFNTFKDFLDLLQRVLDDEKLQKSTPYYNDLWKHFLPQYKYVVNQDDNIIIDDIFHFDDLNGGIHTLNKKLNSNLKLKKQNATKHKHYKEYYNDKNRKLVETIYRKDIEMFDFHF